MSFFWKGFHLTEDDTQRWFYTTEETAIKLNGKDYFNKQTESVVIYRGYETLEHGTDPISGEGFYIKIICRLNNYFGDKSGRHIRTKNYVYYNGRLYQQLPTGEVKYIKRHTTELNGIFHDILQNVRDNTSPLFANGEFVNGDAV